MARNFNIDEFSQLITLDDTELMERHTPASTLERLHRLRGLYAYWLQFPSKFDKDIIQWEMSFFKVKKSQAYEDLHIVKQLLGNLQATSKDFMRWKINQDLEEDLRIARRQGDLRSVAAIEKNRILNNRTDKEDELELEYESIVPQTFEPTNDPTSIGIMTWKGKLPQLKERIEYLKSKYSKDSVVEDAEYEEMEITDDEE